VRQDFLSDLGHTIEDLPNVEHIGQRDEQPVERAERLQPLELCVLLLDLPPKRGYGG
jgi:hypothetical protein